MFHAYTLKRAVEKHHMQSDVQMEVGRLVPVDGSLFEISGNSLPSPVKNKPMNRWLNVPRRVVCVTKSRFVTEKSRGMDGFLAKSARLRGRDSGGNGLMEVVEEESVGVPERE
jgi:hypothetical protein